MRHRITVRSIAALGAAVASLGGLSSCGGSSEVIVARVAGAGSISRSTLEHWMPVEAVVLYQEVPAKPVPRGLMPDPPVYTACAEYLEALAKKAGGSIPTLADLKGRCRGRYYELRELTLNLLIGWHWSIAEGLALGLKVSDSEAKARMAQVISRLFPGGKKEFERYLKLTGQTLADTLFRSKVQLFEVKASTKIESEEKRVSAGLVGKQKEEALARLARGIPQQKSWAEKTSCRTGYVVSACKEYKGTLSPGIPN